MLMMLVGKISRVLIGLTIVMLFFMANVQSVKERDTSRDYISFGLPVENATEMGIYQ